MLYLGLRSEPVKGLVAVVQIDEILIIPCQRSCFSILTVSQPPVQLADLQPLVEIL